jgi:hypothetical protein
MDAMWAVPMAAEKAVLSAAELAASMVEKTVAKSDSL